MSTWYRFTLKPDKHITWPYILPVSFSTNCACRASICSCSDLSSSYLSSNAWKSTCYSKQQVVCPSWPTWWMPFTAFTLQIGGYYSYQHRKLQAAQVTITEPDSAVSAFEASSTTLLKVRWVGPKSRDLRAERNFRLVVRNYYVSRSTVVHFLH